MLEAMVIGGCRGGRQLGFELVVGQHVDRRSATLVERPAGARVGEPSPSQVLPSLIGVGRELTPLDARVKGATVAVDTTSSPVGYKSETPAVRIYDPRVATRIERLLAGPGFAFPDFGSPTEEHVFETTYLDTPDRVLGRAGIVLARRVESGRSAWRLSLPSHELEVESGPRPPRTITDALKAALAGSEALEPVARLRTRRRSVVVEDERGSPTRIVDDEISVLNGNRARESFRELEVASPNGGREAGKLAKRLRAAGATRTRHSELERILAGDELPDVVGQRGVQKRFRTGAADGHLPHVTDVEDSRGTADAEVLVDD